MVNQDLLIPGFDKLEIEVFTKHSSPNYAWFEGTESIRGAYVAPGIIIRGKGLLMVSVATESDCIIPKDSVIGRCKEIPANLLPTIDEYLQEYPEMVAKGRLENQLRCPTLCQQVTTKSYGLTKDNEDLPSVRSEKEFFHKLSQSPKELSECLIQKTLLK